MFNLMNRIYVAFPQEVEIMSRRFIAIYPEANTTAYDMIASPTNKNEIGMVYRAGSFDELISIEFDGDINTFYTFLQSEDKLHILVGPSDYAKLFAYALLELQQTFGISDVTISKILTKQKFKEYLSSLPLTMSSLDDMYQTCKTTYTPTGSLYNASDVTGLALEIVYLLYTEGLISNSIANEKVTLISRTLLETEIGVMIGDIPLAISRDPAIIRSWFNDSTIITTELAMTAISNDLFLTSLFQTGTYDLSIQSTYDDVVKFCNLCIDFDLDQEGEIPFNKAVFASFLELYNTNNIDVIVNNGHSFTTSSFINGRAYKFNRLLMIDLLSTT